MQVYIRVFPEVQISLLLRLLLWRTGTAVGNALRWCSGALVVWQLSAQ